MMMRVLCIGLLALLAAGCGKDPETPSAEASVDASPPSIDAAPPAMSASADVPNAAPAPTASGSSSATPPAADAGALTTSSTGPVVTEADADKTIELAKGQTLTIVLAGNPTSGFDWSVLKSPKALGTADVSFQKGEGMGVAGKKKLVFTLKDALPPGEHSVELGYARSFEKDKPPFKTFKFKVKAAK